MLRGERLLRAMVAACAAIGTGLALHLAAGGAMPHAPGIVVPLALAFAVSLPLAGTSVPRLRLALAVATSQAMFHALFTLGAPASIAVGPDAHGHSHHGHDAAAALAIAGGHEHHGSMIAAHAVAAAMSYAVLRRADVVIAIGAALLGLLLPRIVRHAHRIFQAHAPQAFVVSLSWMRRDVTRNVLLRGPPVLV